MTLVVLYCFVVFCRINVGLNGEVLDHDERPAPDGRDGDE